MAALLQSPIYDTLQGLSDEQIHWTVAILHGQDATREAPWYPAWEHTARKLAYIQQRILSMTVPLICSQQAITFEIDSVDGLANESDFNDEPTTYNKHTSTIPTTNSPDDRPTLLDAPAPEISSKNPGTFENIHSKIRLPVTPMSGVYPSPQRPTKDHVYGPSFINDFPSTPIRSHRRPPSNSPSLRISNTAVFPVSSPLPPSSEPSYFSSSSLSPLEERLREPLFSTSPSVTHRASTDDHLTSDERRILAYANELRSTRIPDLMRRIFKIWKAGEMSIYDLIIEIKKADFLFKSSLNILRRQVVVQAEHIFAADPMVQSIGCILAIGDRWRYEEAYRPTINYSVRAMDADPDYIRETSDPHTSSTGYQSIHTLSNSSSSSFESPPTPNNRLSQTSILGEKFLGDDGFMISICHADSDELLAAVYERLKTLNPIYWSDKGIEPEFPQAINLGPYFNMDTDVYEDMSDGLEDALDDAQVNEYADYEPEDDE